MAKGTIKPMLAGKITDYSALNYPLYASPKIDGCRGMVVDGMLRSRKFLQFPNNHTHNLFSFPRFNGLDGELVVGDPKDPQARNKTSGNLNSIDRILDVKFYVFDNYLAKGGFKERGILVQAAAVGCANIVAIPQVLVADEGQLLEYEAKCLADGYEGLIVRSPDGPYKFGRSTESEGYMLKVKRFLDAEAKILEVYEEMENTNAAEKDAFGRTKRSSAQAGLVGKDRAGGFTVRDIKTGVEFDVPGSTFGDVRKAEFWKARKKLVGKLITYRYFPHGIKDKPLLPTFVAFREDWDRD